jgi:hypothetical protein
MTTPVASLRYLLIAARAWNQRRRSIPAGTVVTRQLAQLGWDRSGGQRERKRLLRQPRTRNVLRETNSSALRRGSAAAPSHRASLVSRNHQVNTQSAAVHASVLRHRRPANSPAALGQQDRWTTPCSAAWWTPPSEATAPVGRILPPGPGVPAALLPGPRRCRLPRQRGLSHAWDPCAAGRSRPRGASPPRTRVRHLAQSRLRYFAAVLPTRLFELCP